MSDRWLPILAAVVGVLGGMGGAFIGGYVANEGQQQRFKEEQASQLRDLRRNAFAEYLRAVQGVISGAHSETLITPEAKVELLAHTRGVRDAALALADNVINEKSNFEQLRVRFINAAKRELEADE
jgi:hypothetical protein